MLVCPRYPLIAGEREDVEMSGQVMAAGAINFFLFLCSRRGESPSSLSDFLLSN